MWSFGIGDEFEAVAPFRHNRLRDFDLGSQSSPAPSEVEEYSQPEERAVVELSVVYSYDADRSLATTSFASVEATEVEEFQGRYVWIGRELQPDSGLIYNRARYFDPNVGQWIGGDALGFNADDANLFKYVSPLG